MKFTNPLRDKPYRKWHRIAYYILLLGCALLSLSLFAAAAWGNDSLPTTVLGWTAVVCVVIFYAINLLKWRCPRCHKTLPLIRPVMQCRYCGQSLTDSKGKSNLVILLTRYKPLYRVYFFANRFISHASG